MVRKKQRLFKENRESILSITSDNNKERIVMAFVITLNFFPSFKK